MGVAQNKINRRHIVIARHGSMKPFDKSMDRFVSIDPRNDDMAVERGSNPLLERYGNEFSHL
jgi:hypothetical protein